MKNTSSEHHSKTPPKTQGKTETRPDHSSSSQPSPGSSGGRRGRSRTRNTATTPGNGEQTGPTTERQSVHAQSQCVLNLNFGVYYRGYHSLMSSFGKVFHVEKRWKLIREMGSGAYGYVM